MKSTSHTRRPYSGTTRSLVIAFDVGTTFSGVSYAILEPGEVPKIHGVTRFPGQEHVAGNSKIPSILYYDRSGKMVVAGAEADNASIISEAEDDGWIKVELFKLRLRPTTMKLKMNGLRLASLPKGKTSVDVFGDFLAYLYHCTKTFFTDTHANGHSLWDAVAQDIQFVLSHPNGWEGAQQTKMRRAMVYGGIIPDTNEGRARIRFVTEGEASLHACVLNGLAADVLSNTSDHGFLIADAGGGTLDLSSYAIRGTHPLVIEEIAPPDCLFAGSVFVSRRAREFLEVKLRNSRYGSPDALDHIAKKFDETTKRLFRDKKEPSFISFGSPLDKDPSVGIRGGQLKLLGTEVAELFEPSIEAAVAAIKAQIEASNGLIKSIWLVGGFAASQWLFGQLQVRLAPLGVTVSRPDSQTSKAVADGAIGFYCDHYVSARMSKYLYGVEYLREYNPDDQDHVARKSRLCELPSGPRLLPDAFDCILARSVKVKESTVFTRKYCTELTSLSLLSVFEVEIWCFRGGNEVPKWIIREAEAFGTLCVVRADLSPLASSAEPKAGKNGKTYWTIVFSVEIHFGLTEFKARIKWNDSGTIKYGPASIIYNESGHRAEEDEPDSSPEDEITVGSTAPSAVPSRAPSRTGFNGTVNGTASKRSSSYSTPKQESFHDVPDVVRSDRDRPPDRDRGISDRGSISHSRHTSVSRPSVVTDKASWRSDGISNGRAPSNPSSPITNERAASANWRNDAARSDKSKGKERERESHYSQADRGRSKDKGSERSINGDERSSVFGKLGDTLSSVWGAAPPAPLSAAPSTSSPLASRGASIYGPPESASQTPIRSRHSSFAEPPAVHDTRTASKVATPRGLAAELTHSPLAPSMPATIHDTRTSSKVATPRGLAAELTHSPLAPSMPGSMPEPEPVTQEVPQHLTPKARSLNLDEAPPPEPALEPAFDVETVDQLNISQSPAKEPAPHLTPKPRELEFTDAPLPDPEPVIADVHPAVKSPSKAPSRAASKPASKVPSPSHLETEIPSEQPPVTSAFGGLPSSTFGFGSAGGGGSSWGSGGFGFGFGTKSSSKAPSIVEPETAEPSVEAGGPSSSLGWGSSFGWGSGAKAGTKTPAKTATPQRTPKAAEPTLEESTADPAASSGWGTGGWGSGSKTGSKPASKSATPLLAAKEPEQAAADAGAESTWGSNFGWGSASKAGSKAISRAASNKAGSKTTSKLNTPAVASSQLAEAPPADPAPTEPELTESALTEPAPPVAEAVAPASVEPAPAETTATPITTEQVKPVESAITSPIESATASPVEFTTTSGKKKKKKGKSATNTAVEEVAPPPKTPEAAPDPDPAPIPAATATADPWTFDVVSPPSGSADNLPQASFTDHLGISSTFDSFKTDLLDDLGLGLSAPKTPAVGDISDLLAAEPGASAAPPSPKLSPKPSPKASPKPSPKPTPKAGTSPLPGASPKPPPTEIPAEPTVEAPPATEDAPATTTEETKVEDTDKDKLQVPATGDDPVSPTTPVSPGDEGGEEAAEEAAEETPAAGGKKNNKGGGGGGGGKAAKGGKKKGKKK